MQFLATHNSYKQRPGPAARLVLNYIALPLGLVSFRDEYGYAFEPLTAQLDRGIRSLELDFMRDGGAFRVGHLGVIDMNSTCPDLALVCREIRMWSRANPGHLPVTLLLEARPSILADGAPYRAFGLDGVLAVEVLLEREFGEALLTPGEILGGYGSFGALRGADGWPPLRDLLGRVLVLYHYSSGTTDAYIALDPALRAQKMFPMLWYPRMEEVDADAASFVLCNEPLELPGRSRRSRAKTCWCAPAWIYSMPTTARRPSPPGCKAARCCFPRTTPPREDPGEDPYTAALEGGYTVRLRASHGK